MLHNSSGACHVFIYNYQLIQIVYQLNKKKKCVITQRPKLNIHIYLILQHTNKQINKSNGKIYEENKLHLILLI